MAGNQITAGGRGRRRWRKKAEELPPKRKGGRIREIAKENSKDPGSAQQGGDLGGPRGISSASSRTRCREAVGEIAPVKTDWLSLCG